jgi:hypothetical protein
MVRVCVLAFVSGVESSMTCGACWWFSRSCSRKDGEAVGHGVSSGGERDMACGQNRRPALTEEFLAQTWRRPGRQGSAHAARQVRCSGLHGRCVVRGAIKGRVILVCKVESSPLI